MTGVQMPRFVVALGEAGKAGELSRIAVAKIGTWWKGSQKIRITREMLAEVIANFRKRPAGADVPIDYDHGIVYAAGSGAAVPAAGWIKGIEDAPDESGILWAMAEWTEQAAKYIEERAYKYFSPVMEAGARDNKTGVQQGWTLTSAALTNIPVLQDLPAIALSEAGWKESDRFGGDGRQATMITKLVMANRAAGTVRAILDEGEPVTLVVEGLEAPPTVFTLSEVRRGTDGRYDFSGVPQDEGVLIASEVMRAMEAQTVLDGAVKEGKILPVQRPQYARMELGDLRTLVASMTAQVAIGKEHGTGGDGSELSDLAKVDGEINTLVEAKIVASAGKMGYGEALRRVGSERRELIARRESLMREEIK